MDPCCYTACSYLGYCKCHRLISSICESRGLTTSQGNPTWHIKLKIILLLNYQTKLPFSSLFSCTMNFVCLVVF